MPHRHEKTIQSELVYQGSMLKVVADLVEGRDGKKFQREYVRHPGAAAVIASLPDGRFVMEKQYRHPHNQVFLEVPAGKLDQGETALEAAKRELKEETGFVAVQWHSLGVLHPCLAYSNEFIEVFLAQNLEQKGAEPDTGEDLEILEMSLEEIHQAIFTGKLTDAKTIAAFHLYGLHFHFTKESKKA